MSDRDAPGDATDRVEVRQTPAGVVVAVLAQAGANRTGVLGVRRGRLRIAVSQAPEKGKANKAIAQQLATALGVAPSRVELTAGASQPEKLILVRGQDAATVDEQLRRPTQ